MRKRTAWIVFGVGSAMATIALSALYVRSVVAWDDFRRLRLVDSTTAEVTDKQLWWCHGRLTFYDVRRFVPAYVRGHSPDVAEWSRASGDDNAALDRSTGLVKLSAASNPTERRAGYVLTIPILPAIPIAAVPALLFGWRFILARRPGAHCRRCGYDLRATPDRCPECGAAAADANAGASG